MAAKKTADLIPLCHPIRITHADVRAEMEKTGVRFVSTVSCTGETGVEMEALVASSVAALTLYDMVKGVQKSAAINNTRLLEKTGGKSGAYRRPGGRTRPRILPEE
jgi:cyclic pyranopterin phosphate synthase